jgi:signal transduction histidine kinase
MMKSMRNIPERKQEESEREHLIEQIKTANLQLQELSSRLLEVQERERKNIATELHDSIASSLTAVILCLSRARPVIETCDPLYQNIITSSIIILKNAIKETRQLMNSLQPPMIDEFGLIASIQWLTEQYRGLYPHLTTHKKITIEESLIPAHLKIILFRIIQEAFTNIAKHSKAEAASIYLKQKENAIHLKIADDGAGFAQDEVNSNRALSSGFGILNMKERAKFSGGKLRIGSARKKGTVISAAWPLSP